LQPASEMAALRIVITVPSLAPEFGGPAIKARQLCKELRLTGSHTTLVTVRQAAGATGLPQLGSFHGTPIPRRIAPLADAIAQADVVHILGYRDPLGVAAAGLARRRRVPYVLEPVGMHRRRLRSRSLKSLFDGVLGRRLISGAACLIATSRLEAGELVEDQVPAERIQLRPNGVDLEDLLPLPARGVLRERVGIPAGAPLVLALGRIARKKGLLDLARALAALDGVWGLVVGPDAGDGTLKALLEIRERLGLGSRLAVMPRGVWGEEKAQAFADADLFCLPSASENFGNAAAEAAACGLPVVLSDQCGAAEWLDPRATLVVPYSVPRDLARALELALLEQPLAADAREAAAGLARSLSWHDVAGRQLAIYRSVVVSRDRSESLGGPPRGPLKSRRAGRRAMTPRW
jgi:glycosyltransferase involved in cell wall biosynthesis